jgi:hypothetical protein
MTRTREQMITAARAAFSEDALNDIVAALDQYGVEKHEPEREHVQLAIIALCGGDKDRLLRYVHEAKVDYRDILAAQQLGPLSEDKGRQLQDVARALISKWGKV